jgi:hypothetical protein
MYLITKEELEKQFGRIEYAIYERIVTSVQNDMQQVVDLDGIPSKQNFINILSTNTEFFLKHTKAN